MLRTSLLVCLVACGQVAADRPDAGDDPDKSIAVAIDPAPHYVRTGAQQTIAVTLTRTGVTGPVTVEVASPPAGMTIAPITIDGDTAELVVAVAADAPFARSALEVTASAGGELATTPLAIEIIGQPGALDPTFGTGGVQTIAGSDKYEAPMFAIPQGDRIVVGIVVTRGGKAGVLVVRRTREGAADPDFGITGSVGETFLDLSTIGLTSVSLARAMAHPDGRIAIVGHGSNGSDTDAFIVRLTPDGHLDPTLALRRLNSATANDQLAALAIGPSDEIVVAGHRSTSAGRDAMLMRIDASGQLDRTFGSNGVLLYNELELDDARGVVVQRDGRIVAMISIQDGTMVMPEFALRRFGSDGWLDSTFGTGGKAALPTPDQWARGEVLASPDGLQLVVAGSASADLTTGELAIWRFLADGRLDLGFAGGVGYWRSADAMSLNHLAIAADGSLYGFGNGTFVVGESVDLFTVHLDPAGVPDPAFGTAGIARDEIGESFPRAVALRGDHRSVVVTAPLIAGDATDTFVRSYWH